MLTLRLTQSSVGPDEYGVEVRLEEEGQAPQTATARFAFALSDQDGEDLRWYLEDYVIFGAANAELSGAGFYEDEYAKVDGAWRIHRTGYVRTYEQFAGRDAVQQLRTMFDAGGERDSAGATE